jgi:uncharacterized protein
MQTVPEPSVTGRIAVVDVLRAFALFGIIITHSGSGFLAARPPTPDFMTFTQLDEFVALANRMLIFGKFFTIFSFLFGLSFALQMRSAEAKGRAFVGRFSWRLLLLALIALVHNAFFSGDILIIYAVLGFFLIPFRNVSTKWLLVTGVVLVLNLPVLVYNAMQINAPPPSAEQQAASTAAQPAITQSIRAHYDAKQSGSVADVVRANLGEGFAGKWQFQLFTGRLWVTFGLFLFGVAAGRLGIFRDSAASRSSFRRVLWVAGSVALATTVFELVRPMTYQVRTLTDLLASFSFTIQQLSLSAFYVALVTLLCWRSPAGWLWKLAPAGKMGLTVYLTQTAFGVLLFYGIGFGMLGHMGVAAAAGCAIAFYPVQLAFARWWMSRFSMGPVEWLWRSLTYFRWQSTMLQDTRPTERCA